MVQKKLQTHCTVRKEGGEEDEDCILTGCILIMTTKGRHGLSGCRRKGSGRSWITHLRVRWPCASLYSQRLCSGGVDNAGPPKFLRSFDPFIRLRENWVRGSGKFHAVVKNVVHMSSVGEGRDFYISLQVWRTRCVTQA